MKLTDLKPQQVAQLRAIEGDSGFIRRLYDLGFYPGCELKLRKRLGKSGSVVVGLRSTSYSMRFEEAQMIEVEVKDV